MEEQLSIKEKALVLMEADIDKVKTHRALYHCTRKSTPICEDTLVSTHRFSVPKVEAQQ